VRSEYLPLPSLVPSTLTAPINLPDSFLHALHPPLLRLPRLDAPLSFEKAKLPFQLRAIFQALPGKASFYDRSFDSAARLAAVPAIPEPALLRQDVNFLERAGDAISGFPELELAHARRVNDDSASGKDEKLPRGRRVLAPVIALTHGLDALRRLLGQGVDDRRLPYSRGTDERRRLPRRRYSCRVSRPTPVTALSECTAAPGATRLTA
jgi:hypothetical protein